MALVKQSHRPMKIELRRPHKSIEDLTTEELPDFAILIGRNGAGKTQLLEALQRGSAGIPDIGVDEIKLFDMATFHPPNTFEATRQTDNFAIAAADAFLLPASNRPPPIETATMIFNEFVSEIESGYGVQTRDEFIRDLRGEIRNLPDFSVFGVVGRQSQYKQKIYQQVLAPFEGVRQPTRSSTLFSRSQATLLSAAMRLTAKLPHELDRDDIMRAVHSEGETLTNSISEVFAAYKVDQYMWTHTQFELGRDGFDDLVNEYRTKYPPPWETLREILSQMRDVAGADGVFDFDFSDPDDSVLNLANYEQFAFKAEMTNLTTGTAYELDSLSSGEKILMALCLVSFNLYLGRRPPKLLLLDELDAVLHPSMVAALVNILRDLFVSNGAKVLMTSHSAMTIAVLDETDIYRVSRTGGVVEVVHTTKSEAINELSEGLATVDVGLRIAAYDAAKVTILSEGHNAKHLKRWVDLNFPADVHVFEELGQYTNDEQLLTYGRLLGRMNTNTHFVVVWDCDAKGKAETLRGQLPSAAKVEAYAFKKRLDNTIADSGIENIYDEEVLKPFSNTVTNHEGAIVARSFQNSRKTEFANHVLQNGTAEYFTHLQDLHDIISGILDSTPPTTSPGCEEESV